MKMLRDVLQIHERLALQRMDVLGEHVVTAQCGIQRGRHAAARRAAANDQALRAADHFFELGQPLRMQSEVAQTQPGFLRHDVQEQSLASGRSGGAHLDLGRVGRAHRVGDANPARLRPPSLRQVQPGLCLDQIQCVFRPGAIQQVIALRDHPVDAVTQQDLLACTGQVHLAGAAPQRVGQQVLGSHELFEFERLLRHRHDSTLVVADPHTLNGLDLLFLGLADLRDRSGDVRGSQNARGRLNPRIAMQHVRSCTAGRHQEPHQPSEEEHTPLPGQQEPRRQARYTPRQNDAVPHIPRRLDVLGVSVDPLPEDQPQPEERQDEDGFEDADVSAGRRQRPQSEHRKRLHHHGSGLRAPPRSRRALSLIVRPRVGSGNLILLCGSTPFPTRCQGSL